MARPSRILERSNTKASTGRDTILTPELITNICNALRTGAYIETACLSVGINKGSLYTWIAKGRTGVEPYKTLLDELQKVRAETQVELLSRIKEVGMDKEAKLWTAAAWILERTDPEHYGRLDRRQIDLSGSARINIVKEVVAESDRDDYQIEGELVEPDMPMLGEPEELNGNERGTTLAN